MHAVTNKESDRITSTSRKRPSSCHPPMCVDPQETCGDEGVAASTLRVLSPVAVPVLCMILFF